MEGLGAVTTKCMSFQAFLNAVQNKLLIDRVSPSSVFNKIRMPMMGTRGTLYTAFLVTNGCVRPVLTTCTTEGLWEQFSMATVKQFLSSFVRLIKREITDALKTLFQMIK